MQGDFTRRYFRPLLLLLFLCGAVVWFLARHRGLESSDGDHLGWANGQLHLKDSLSRAKDSLRLERAKQWEERKAQWDAQWDARRAAFDAPVELNTASEEELTKLKGIGPSRAKAIVEYRQRLGGFISLEQLREIRTLPRELLDELDDKFLLDTMVIRKININFATQNALKAHPYISENIARRIAKGIKMKGVIVNYQQLIKSDILTPKEARKIAPYLLYDTVAYSKLPRGKTKLK